MPSYPVEETLLREPNLWVPGRKPVGNVKIDWNHPLTVDLIGCWLFQSDYRNLADNRYPTIVGTVPIKPSFNGMAASVTDDNTSDRVNLGSITSADRLSGNPSGEISFYSFGNRGTSTSHGNNFPRLFDKSTAGFAANGWAVYHDFSVDTITFGVNGDGTPPASENISALDGIDMSAGVSAKSGDVNFYINGEFNAKRTDTVSFSATTCNAALLNWNHTTDRQVREPVYCIYVWDRMLSAKEHASIHIDRYQFLIPA